VHEGEGRLHDRTRQCASSGRELGPDRVVTIWMVIERRWARDNLHARKHSTGFARPPRCEAQRSRRWRGRRVDADASRSGPGACGTDGIIARRDITPRGVESIELRCREHNLYEGELDFGPAVLRHGKTLLCPSVPCSRAHRLPQGSWFRVAWPGGCERLRALNSYPTEHLRGAAPPPARARPRRASDPSKRTTPNELMESNPDEIDMLGAQPRPAEPPLTRADKIGR
jgi:hypothetical protein